MAKNSPQVEGLFQLDGRLEAICTLASDVRSAQERPWLIEDATQPARGLRREFADRALDLMEGVRFNYSAPADILLWKLLTGLLPHDACLLDQQFKLTSVPGLPLAWASGLASVRRHPAEARQLCYLLSMDQYAARPHQTDLAVFNDLSGEYFDAFATVASLFNAGLLLADLEESDPNLSTVRPGIQAFVNRSLVGEAVTATKMVGTLRSTLTRIWETTTPLA